MKKNWKFGKIPNIRKNKKNSEKYSGKFGGRIRKNTQNSEKYSQKPGYRSQNYFYQLWLSHVKKKSCEEAIVILFLSSFKIMIDHLFCALAPCLYFRTCEKSIKCKHILFDQHNSKFQTILASQDAEEVKITVYHKTCFFKKEISTTHQADAWGLV